MATAKKTKKGATKKPTKVANKKVAAKKPKSTVKPKAKTKPVAKKKTAPKAVATKKSPAKKASPVTTKKASGKSVKPKATPTVKANKSAGSTKATKPASKAWMQPLDDRILVEVIEENQTSPGGIIIVDSSTQPDNLSGFVLSVGRGHQNKKGRIRPIELKAGDKIIFSKYAGDKISKDGVNFVIIRETEVLGFASN